MYLKLNHLSNTKNLFTIVAHYKCNLCTGNWCQRRQKVLHDFYEKKIEKLFFFFLAVSITHLFHRHFNKFKSDK